MLRIVTVVGARPQLVKAAAVSRAILADNAGLDTPIEERLVHTGQHYDHEMSEVFFGELDLPQPSYHLAVGSGMHAEQTGQMMSRLEPLFSADPPDLVVVYGDTNSTLAAVLTAAKLNISVAHIEAGLRSGRRDMPEEINRIVADRLASLLFCPSDQSVRNLAGEGIQEQVFLVGDVMQDVLAWRLPLAQRHAHMLAELRFEPGEYLLCTLHRAANTDNDTRLRCIISALEALVARGHRILFPAHPRVRRALADRRPRGVTFTRPISYDEMLYLESQARTILTDSGGVQKEAYWLGTPCVTLREETEWVETLHEGWNVLAGADPERILAAVEQAPSPRGRQYLYGTGRTASAILRHICNWSATGSPLSGKASERM